MYRHSFSLAGVSLAVLVLSGGCVTDDLAQLQSDVNELHSRIYQMQRSNERQTTTTTSSLRQVSKEISDAFDEIRFTQSGLEEKVDQLSNRLLTQEQRMEAMEASVAQLENKMGQSDQTLRNDLNTQRQQQETTSAAQVAEINQLRSDLTAFQERHKSEMTALNETVRKMSSDLQKEMNGLHAEVRNVYQDILKELGSTKETAPAATAETTTPASSYSGDEYIVETGDTLNGIARKLGVTTEALSEANGITDPNMIRVGQHLKVPK
ncbi:MAG TPA: LysM peptidoglycan-binding domain-containing protein [bacterium]|mgnify:FL=1|nr:LysM peptidoglycan-binding domain-containing protein [bacterium]HQL62004.1 LysM peptidoglycan-binding domain-containing protein [bacterium]